MQTTGDQNEQIECPALGRCFALRDGHCSHIECPRPHHPLRACPWVLKGHITDDIRPLPHEGDDRPVNL